MEVVGIGVVTSTIEVVVSPCVVSDVVDSIASTIPSVVSLVDASVSLATVSVVETPSLSLCTVVSSRGISVVEFSVELSLGEIIVLSSTSGEAVVEFSESVSFNSGDTVVELRYEVVVVVVSLPSTSRFSSISVVFDSFLPMLQNKH